MLAERAADLILGKAPLKASNAEVRLGDDWQTKQRQNAPKRNVTN
jgi:choline dehydrogenase